MSAAQKGFTLIEVTVAASLLLLTAVCATPLLAGSQQAGSRASRGTEAGRLAESTLERLRSLPFASPASRSGDGDPSESSVVGAVFPHADVARNTADAFVVLVAGADWPAGTFVTRRCVAGFEITTESLFGAATSDGLAPLSPVLLAGFDSSTGGGLPSGILFVTVVVSWTERGRELCVTRRTALQDESPVEAGESPAAFQP